MGKDQQLLVLTCVVDSMGSFYVFFFFSRMNDLNYVVPDRKSVV